MPIDKKTYTVGWMSGDDEELFLRGSYSVDGCKFSWGITNRPEEAVKFESPEAAVVFYLSTLAYPLDYLKYLFDNSVILRDNFFQQINAGFYIPEDYL